MAQRGFGNITVTGTLQPVFGCLTGGPINPTPDPWAGTLDPRANRSTAKVAVANAALFRTGDHVQIGPSSDFIVQDLNQPDGGTVYGAVDYVNNFINVQGLTRKHNASEWCVLALPCAQVNVQSVNNGLSFYEDATTTYPLGTITPLSGFSSGVAAFGNLVETQHMWVQGTTVDTFIPYVITI